MADRRRLDRPQAIVGTLASSPIFIRDGLGRARRGLDWQCRDERRRARRLTPPETLAGASGDLSGHYLNNPRSVPASAASVFPRSVPASAASVFPRSVPASASERFPAERARERE